MKGDIKTRNAIRKYTVLGCVRAAYLNDAIGQGARTIAQQYDIPNVTTTAAADAAIEAGRVIAADPKKWRDDSWPMSGDLAVQAAHWTSNIKSIKAVAAEFRSMVGR